MQNSPLSNLAQTLIGSEIVKISGTIKEKIKQGEHIYNYTIGDFDSTQFPIPAELCEEIKNAYQNGFTNYPIADGEADTREAVLEFLKNNEALDYNHNEILIAAGGRPLIYAVFRALVDAGDKVIYPIPSWNNNHYAHFTAAQHVVIHTEQANNFMPTAAQIKPHLKGATLLALCSPLNPTGTVFTKEGLEEICNLIIQENASRAADEKKLYLMYDQIYWTLTFGDTKHYNPVSLNAAMRPYTIFIDGISKAFAATGVRVGWALGPENVIVKMKAINSHVGAWAPMAEQKAVAKFLKQKEAVSNYFTHFKKEIEYRLQEIYNGFDALKKQGYSVDVIAPQAAIYLTVQINLVGKVANGKKIETQKDVTAYILNEAKLALVPFFAFGAAEENNWYRISVGCVKKEEISEMFSKLKLALDKLV
jgi:aspartate aminotransferase